MHLRRVSSQKRPHCFLRRCNEEAGTPTRSSPEDAVSRPRLAICCPLCKGLFFLRCSYMPVAGGDGVQVALILRASSCALGFARRPPPHLGARCTSHFVTHVYAHCPRALSLRWGSLHSVMIEGGGSAVSNGRRNMGELMLFPLLFCATGPAGLTRLSHFNEYVTKGRVLGSRRT